MYLAEVSVSSDGNACNELPGNGLACSSTCKLFLLEPTDRSLTAFQDVRLDRFFFWGLNIPISVRHLSEKASAMLLEIADSRNCPRFWGFDVSPPGWQNCSYLYFAENEKEPLLITPWPDVRSKITSVIPVFFCETDRLREGQPKKICYQN
jgi:hypothetical protein